MGYQLCLHRIAISLALQQSRTGTPFCICQAVENIDFPACRNGNAVRPRGFRIVKTACTARRCKVKRRQIGQSCRFQRGLRLCDTKLCNL